MFGFLYKNKIWLIAILLRTSYRNNIVIWLINKRIQAIREENIDFF